VAKTARCGNDLATDGTVGGKNGKVLMDAGHLQAANPAVARGREGCVCDGMRLFKVLAARGGVVEIELNYDDESRMSSEHRCARGAQP
jgi:hypothetical protein